MLKLLGIWRYRLMVRTGGSHPPNRGSIPRSATKNSECYQPPYPRAVLSLPKSRPAAKENFFVLIESKLLYNIAKLTNLNQSYEPKIFWI